MAVIRASRTHTSLGTLTRRTPHPAYPCSRTPFSLDRFSCVKGDQHPPLGALAPFPHALLARNGVCHTGGVGAIVPANGTQSDKLGIASPQPIFSLDPYHEHPDDRCMPHVTGTTYHIACTTTSGPDHSHLSQRPCPAPFFPNSVTSAAVLARKILSNVVHYPGHLFQNSSQMWGETRGRGRLASLSFMTTATNSNACTNSSPPLQSSRRDHHGQRLL